MTSRPEEILADAEQYGVDLSMLRERLRWTPTERLERHQMALGLIEALRNAKRTPKRARTESAADRPVRS